MRCPLCGHNILAQDKPDFLQLPISRLNVPVRIANCLEAGGHEWNDDKLVEYPFKTLQDIINYCEKGGIPSDGRRFGRLLCLRNFGKTSLAGFERAMKKLGIKTKYEK